MTDPRIVPCEYCHSEGRDLRGNGPEPIDYGPCIVCEGSGGEIVETQPIEFEDLDAMEAK